MASSKKNKNTTPQDQALAAKRVAFVKSKPDLAPAEARTRFFVQTRAAELQAKGVEVTKQRRQELRQKFASGDVQRQGFYTPTDIARAAARNTGTGGGATGGSTGAPLGTSGSRPQDLADYKNTVYSNLSKENTARRQVAPKAPKGFDEQSFSPSQFFKSPLATGIAKLGKGAYNLAESTGESFNATFVNPTANLIGSGLNKVIKAKPGTAWYYDRQREAGPVEAAINTADVALTIATFGASKAVTAVPVAAAKKGLITRTATKFVDATKTTTASKVGPKLKAATPVKSSTPKAGVKTAKSADGTPSFLKTPDAPKPVKARAAAKPKATPKPKASAAPKNAAGKPYQRMRDIDFDAKFGTPAEQNAARRAADADQAADAMNNMGPSKTFDFGDEFGVVRFEDDASDVPSALRDLMSGPKAAPKPKATPKPKAAPKPKASAAKPAAAPKATKKEINRFADAWDDSPVDMNKVDFKEFAIDSAKPYGTAKRSGKAAPAAKAKSPEPKPPAKTTKPKARAKAGFKAKVNEVKSTPTPAANKSSFSSQGEYDSWLSKGGKQELRNMTQSARDSFLETNKKFVVGAGKKAQQASTSQSQKVQRALKTEKLYKGARPELQAKFNKALLNRQQRQLLAKIAPKK